MNASADLHRTLHSVIFDSRKTMRNALANRGPVILLNRRDGFKPLWSRRFKPAAVCGAALPRPTPVGVVSVTPPTKGFRAPLDGLSRCPEAPHQGVQAPGQHCSWGRLLGRVPIPQRLQQEPAVIATAQAAGRHQTQTQ